LLLACAGAGIVAAVGAMLPGGSPAFAQQPTRVINATRSDAATLPGARGGAMGGGGETDGASDVPAPIPSGDPSLDPQEQDDFDAPRDGQRAVLRDGETAQDGDQPVLRDGVIEVGEPQAPQDGADPTLVDTRPPEDIAIFENPPAGFDPLLFQIEELDPVQDRRTRRLFGREPYDPVGIAIGSFVLFPQIETGLSYYSNVFRSPSAEADRAFDFRPSARLVSNWRAHALELRAAGNFSAYDEFDSENDRGYLVEGRGRLDVTRRTNIQALVSRELTQESRSAIDAIAAGDRANITSDRLALTANHRFNRLSLQMRGSVTDYDYGAQSAGVGTVSNDDRDYTVYDQAARLTWEFKPTLLGFTEVAINQRRYDAPNAADGIIRNSDGQRWRVGLGFGETGQILRGELAVGYGVQTPEDDRLDAVDGIILDANVAWRVSELTSLLFTARSDIAETTTTGADGVFTRGVGIEARHTFRRHLVASAGLGVVWNDFAGVAIQERDTRATLGAEYFVNRDVVLFGRYAHTWFESTQPAADYTNDEVHVGVRLRR
jgi:hypothetical protein